MQCKLVESYRVWDATRECSMEVDDDDGEALKSARRCPSQEMVIAIGG